MSPRVTAPALSLRNDPIDVVVQIGRLLGRARDDQRRARFVDEDAVHLVHDREVMPALDVVREIELHVVAQVVEAELVVGAVGDVAGVGDLALGVVEIVLDDADGHPEEAVDLAHPLRVASGQVVVHGDDVDALALERVEIGRQRRDERLAFAGLHLGDPALVKNGAADQLDVEVPHAQHAAAGLANDGEGFRQAGRRGSRPWRAARGTRRSWRAAARPTAPRRASSKALTSPTIGRKRLRSRSFWVPMTFARSVWIIYSGADPKVSNDCSRPAGLDSEARQLKV